MGNELQTLIRDAVKDVAGECEGLSVVSVTATRGWGDTESVAIQVSTNTAVDRDAAELRLRDAVAAALPRTRHRVTIRWTAPT